MRISKVLILLLFVGYILVIGRIALKAIRPAIRDYVGGYRHGYKDTKYLSACFLHYFYQG